MWENRFEEHVLNLGNEREKAGLADFLAKQGLSLDKEIEYAMVLTGNGRIAAAGSFSGRVLKCIAVDEEYQSAGLAAKVVTHLVNEQFRRGRSHLFVFTKPENQRFFSDLGMYPVAVVPSKVILMENRRDGIKKYLEEIAGEAGTIVPSAAAVVNCNPFTLGHKYLLEYAAGRCERLHVFVVWEDRSSFPSEIRYKLVKEGLAHLSNVIVHKGKDYIISDATFPTYFLKKQDEQVEIHARLDAAIFSQYIAKALQIRKRYVGEEPCDPVTAVYNRVMGDMLPAAGIELEIDPRKTAGNRSISASLDRELIRAGDLSGVKELVPENTYQFLLSPGAGEILSRIQQENNQRG